MNHRSPPKRHTFDRQLAHVGAWMRQMGRLLTPDFEAAQTFLLQLNPTAEDFVFRTFSDTAYTRHAGEDPLEQEFFGSLCSCWNQLLELNRRGAAICVRINITVSITSATNNKDKIRSLFVDDDTPQHQPRRFPLRPHLTVESSPRRYHYYWLTTGLGLPMFPLLQKLLAERYQTDHRVFDINQAMRLPGFWRRKDPQHPQLARLVQCGKDAPYTAEQLNRLIPVDALIQGYSEHVPL